MASEMLKPCATCGGHTFFVLHDSVKGRNLGWRVQCDSCKIVGPWAETEEGAIAIWNKEQDAAREKAAQRAITKIMAKNIEAHRARRGA